MRNEKTRRVDQSGILAALLAFIDLALLVWIGISYYEIRQKEQLAAYYADLNAVSQQAAAEIPEGPETDAPVSRPDDGGNLEVQEEPEPGPETEDTVCTGSRNDGEVLAADSGESPITVFYEYDGRRFGVGQFLTPDGESAVAATIRL